MRLHRLTFFIRRHKIGRNMYLLQLLSLQKQLSKFCVLLTYYNCVYIVSLRLSFVVELKLLISLLDFVNFIFTLKKGKQTF